MSNCFLSKAKENNLRPFTSDGKILYIKKNNGNNERTLK